ncbi:MAG TPA: sensor domain-containing diguanylate cyclase [Dissulfurispiraceae bacterium]
MAEWLPHIIFQNSSEKNWLNEESEPWISCCSKEETTFRLLADLAPVFLWAADNGNIERFYFNKVWLDYRGRSLAEEAGRGWLEGIHKDDYNAFHSTCAKALSEKKPYKAEYRLKRKDGVFRWVLETGVPFCNPDTKTDGFIGSCVGITEKKELEGQLLKMAHYDMLTGIANRSLFVNRLEHAIAVAERYRTRFAILYIDLDGFKAVNDQYGHKVGDMLLIETARRLTSCIRKSDTAARLGGDEFTVILTRVHGKKDASLIAGKIAREIAKPYSIFGQKCHVSASIGIGIFPDDAADLEGLMKKADMDMYHKKGSQRSIYHREN